jgi:YceI-like domain
MFRDRRRNETPAAAAGSEIEMMSAGKRGLRNGRSHALAMSDSGLRSAAFLDSAEHPSIDFVSTSVERISDHAVRVSGDLTLLIGDEVLCDVRA